MQPLLVFVHIEKTAGISLNRILRASFGLRHCDIAVPLERAWVGAEDLTKIQRIYPRLESIAGHQIKPYCDLDSVRSTDYFTMLREPIARCASHYQHQMQKMGKTIRFEDWMKNPKYWDFQTKKLAESGRAEDAIEALQRFHFVGLTEQFPASVLMLKQRTKWKTMDVRYERKNAAFNNDIRDQLYRDHRDQLDEMNREDVKVHRFVVEHLYPQFVSEYEGDLEADAARLKTIKPPRIQVKLFLNLLKRNLQYKPWCKRHIGPRSELHAPQPGA